MGKALICGQAFNKKAKDSWSRNVNRKFIAAQPGATISPSIQGRIICVGATCPVVTP